MWPYTTDELAFFTQGAGVLCNPKKAKETKMNYFNIDTVTSEYAKNAKTMLSFVPNDSAKNFFEKIVDAQVEATKLVATVAETAVKSATEYAKKAATFGK